MNRIQDLESLRANINSGDPLLLYFSGQRCTVCHALKPKLEAALSEYFPQLQALEVDAEKQLDIAGQFLVFTVPTTLVFAGGREYFRFGRNMSIVDFVHQLKYLLYHPE